MKRFLFSLAIVTFTMTLISGCNSGNEKRGDDEKQNQGEELKLAEDVCFYEFYTLPDSTLSRIYTLLNENNVKMEVLPRNNVLVVCPAEDKALVDSIFKLPVMKDILPEDFHYLWNNNTRDNLKTMLWLKREPVMKNGIAEIKSSEDMWDNEMIYAIDITFNEENAKCWEDVTTANIGKPIAIVVDNEVISFPTVQSTIVSGKSQITLLSEEERDNLLNKITGKKE